MKTIHRKVLQMRESGKTYKEICQSTGLASSSVSYIVGKHFPKGKNAKISARNNRAYKQSEAFTSAQRTRNEAAKEMYVQRHAQLKYDYLRTLRKFLDQNFIYYVAGLYEGEGAHKGTSFDFCNSDPKLILPFLRLLREVLGFGEDRFTLRLSLHSSLPREGCVAYWEGVCGHGIDAVDQYDARPQRKVHRHKETFYGTLTVRTRRPNGLKSALGGYAY